MNKKKVLIFSILISAIFFTSYMVFGWSEPTTTMPSSYFIPLNTSAAAQIKSGTLTVPILYDSSNQAYYVNPNGNSSIFGKIISQTSTDSSDIGKTIATKDYVDSVCQLVAFGAATTTACPAGYYVTEMLTSAQTGYMLCCKVSNPL
ncbi:MAG: hypothetical protein PHG24_00725 [Candidatus Pacebacteria bacterium]|nr:hypothetical protein [Candidatus Paceibacterota bacterium]